MEKQRPEVTIEEAIPLSGSSSQSDSDNDFNDKKRKPQRLNMLPTTGYPHTSIPRGMRPANSTVYEEEEETENFTESPPLYPKSFLATPLLLVAASIGVGVLITIYGTKLLKPAIKTIVKSAGDITEEIIE